MRTIKKKGFTVLSSFLEKIRSKKTTVTAINERNVKKPRLGTIAKKSIQRRASFIGIVFIIVAYCILFFWMRDKLLFTPDFGESDSYHFNLSLKYFLSDSLKKNSIPFWTNSLSGGYPLFSESQIGSLFLPNIIFLKFLHFTDGYTLLFIFAFICLTVGFFLLLREFEIGLLISIFMSIMLAFNGAISLRWVHLNLIQTFSLIPFCFFVSLMYLRSHRLRYVLTLSFLVSQMFFAGHVQVIFIGMLGLIIWVFLHEITDKKSLKEIIIEIGFICCAFILGIVIALPQILPTYLLSQQATRSFQLDYQLTTSFPLTWSHLKSFFDPFPFGNPQNGTYPVYSANWGIFWENTPYLGRFFLPMLCIALFYLQKAVLRKKIIIYGILFSIFTLLALGKNSPLYFVFNFFPFNLFRTPSKYLIMSSLFILFGLSCMLRELFQKVQNKLVHIFILLLMMANISDLIHFAFTYHLFVPSQVLLTVPESARFISDDQYYFILDPYTSWNDVFLKRGWSTKQEVESYVFMKNFLYPNSNLIVNKKNYAINTGAFHLRRVEYMKNLIEKLVSKEKGVITPYIHNLLEIIGIRTIVSGYPLKGDMLQEETVLIHNDSTIYIYTLAYPKSDWYYIPQTLERVEFIDDFEKKITDRSITARNAVAEGIEKRENNSEYTITNSNGYNDRFELSGNFKNDTFIALRINYYPEWSVLIDGKKTAIYKTNLTHMGLNVPKGKHEVVIRYENWYFKIGLVLSLFATAGCAFILVKSKRL